MKLISGTSQHKLNKGIKKSRIVWKYFILKAFTLQFHLNLSTKL